jgi:hypothetical protein
MFSGYECLQNIKPYQGRNITPREFKVMLQACFTGHSTLIDVFLPKEDLQRQTLIQW